MKVVTYLGSLVQSCCREGGTLQTKITEAYVGSARTVLVTLGLSTLTACVLSQSTLLRLQVALQGNCLKQALGCMHFPGLSCSGSGSRVLHKGTDSVGPAFCAPSQVRASQMTRCLASALSPGRGWGVSYHLLCPSCSVSWVRSRSAVSGVPRVCSGELISGCDPPCGCQPCRIPGRLG